MTNKNDIKRLILLIIIGVISYLLISNFEMVFNILDKLIDAIFPFILGIILAFVLNIPMMKIENLLNNLQKKRKRKIPMRVISITISLIIFIVFIIFIAFNLVPELISNIETLIRNIPGMINNAQKYLLGLVKDFPEIQAKVNDLFANNGKIDDIIVTILNYVVNGSVEFITKMISSIITIFTSLIFAIYMLSQKEYLISGIKKVLSAYLNKKTYNKVINISKLANKTFSNFVSGQCLEAVILGVILFVVLSIFRFPYALLISVLTTITALIPIFGALIAGAVGAVLIATINPVQALIFIIVFLIVQQIEGNLIYPKVVGKSVGLSPIWTLLAVTVGGSLFGILGMLIGLPLASILYALFKKDINIRLEEQSD